MKIAIIGDGPRGLLITSHLVHYFSQSSVQHLQILLCDHFPIGGRIWQTNQSQLFIMNTIAQQMTMFDRRSFTGPNLYQWSKGQAANFIKQDDYKRQATFLNIIHHLGPNDYAPRCLFGVYLQWFFRQIKEYLPKEVTIQKIDHNIHNIQATGRQYQITTDNGQTYRIDKVVINGGQEVNQPTANEKSLSQYARQHQLKYFPVGYVEEKDFQSIQPRQKVIVRGLGLNFIDCVKLLTLGRGGHFHHHQGHLVYSPSGKEPRIIAGSRSGLPYYCKANNQKINGHHSQPYFINAKHIKVHLRNHKISYHDFIRLLRLDMELVYYTRLIKNHYPHKSPQQFKTKFLQARDPEQTIQEYHFKPNELMDWKRILNPVAGLKITNLNNYRKAVLRWLSLIIKDAKRGNLNSSLASALEVIRDSRNQIRTLISQHRFTLNDYLLKFLPVFDPVSRFLSLGAPVSDIAKVKALIKARIITLVGPRINIVGAQGHFMCNSTFYPKEIFKADVMIEARNPSPKISYSECPLIHHLFKSGILSQPVFTLDNGRKIKLDIANVKPQTDQLINKKGQLEKNLYGWGLLTEGIHWCTSNAPHPSGHDVNLKAAVRISRQVLGLKTPKFSLM